MQIRMCNKSKLVKNTETMIKTSARILSPRIRMSMRSSNMTIKISMGKGSMIKTITMGLISNMTRLTIRDTTKTMIKISSTIKTNNMISMIRAIIMGLIFSKTNTLLTTNSRNGNIRKRRRKESRMGPPAMTLGATIIMTMEVAQITMTILTMVITKMPQLKRKI